VKNFAKLVLLFSISFLAIFLISTVFRFLALRVDWAKRLPVKPETALTLLIAAAHWALSLSLFASLLFALGYSLRRGYLTVMTLSVLMSLSFVFCFGILTVLVNMKTVTPAQTSGIPLGGKGLMLSNTLNRNETVVVLLGGTAEPLGPRVTSNPGQPLVYQQFSRSDFELPSVSFGDDTPWFLKSLAIDLRLNAGVFQQKYSEGFGSFLVYAGAIIFFLCSLGLAIKFSAWPLANLFIGILAFRGVLALEVFLNTPEIQETMGAFLKDTLPVSFAIPVIFIAFGALLQLYSMLILITKRRNEYD
jgi:hypothetical protein